MLFVTYLYNSTINFRHNINRSNGKEIIIGIALAVMSCNNIPNNTSP